MDDAILPPALIALATRVIAENRAIGRRIVLAESCTGGLVAAALTEVPGSSDVFDRGFVTYSNAAKQQMLGVGSEILDTFGAVSIACAWSMAQGALRHSDGDVAVAVSGVAGPGGGSTEKPVGTVVFARAIRGVDGADAEERHLDGGSRGAIRAQAVEVALELLLP